MRDRRLRNEQRLKKDKLEVLLSKDYTWQMEKRKQEQIKVSFVTAHGYLLSKKLMMRKRIGFVNNLTIIHCDRTKVKTISVKKTLKTGKNL